MKSMKVAAIVSEHIFNAPFEQFSPKYRLVLGYFQIIIIILLVICSNQFESENKVKRRSFC